MNDRIAVNCPQCQTQTIAYLLDTKKIYSFYKPEKRFCCKITSTYFCIDCFYKFGITYQGFVFIQKE